MSLVWGALNATGLLFGLAWLWVNLYLHYPIVRAIVGLARRGIGTPKRSSLDTRAEEIESSGREATDGGTNQPPSKELEFDVLLPAYEESSVIENSIASVRNADYRKDQINLIVLTEPDDDETRATLEELADEYDFTELGVPEAYPGNKNKPRALNYGFDQTTGDIVSVIDAENVFHPTVFKRASARFLDPDVDFLQGRLDMVNEDDGWLNTFFRAEYGYWYRLIFPRFFGAEYPIPMGGTTCLFRRSVLEQISTFRRERYGDSWSESDQIWVEDHGIDGSIPWDPENVTEDFELGMFLWQNGYRSGYLSAPVTDEESPLTLSSWMGQRTRWQKGKIYTLLHNLRHPPDTNSECVHLYTQAAIPHLGVVNILALFLIFLAANLGGYTWHSLPKAFLLIGLGFLGLTMVEYGMGYWLASDRPPRTRFRRATVVIVAIPFYWILHWLADIRAFLRTYRGEFHWVKTEHAGRNISSPPSSSAVRATHESSDRWTLSRETNLAALGSIAGVALAVRMYNITGWSLFNDELYSIGRARISVADLLFVIHDTHPPLHYLILHYWMEFFGKSQLSVRMLSVVFSVATVVAVYFLGMELYNDRAGLAAALVTALSVYHVHFAQNTRMYALMAFLTTVSWYGFTVMKSKPHRGSLIYGPATALLLYTHLWAVFVVIAQNIYLFLSENQEVIDWQRWLRAQFLIGLCTTPIFAFYLSALFSPGGRSALIDWLQPPTLYNIVELMRQFAGIARQYPLIEGTGVSVPAAIFIVLVYAILVFAAVVRHDPQDGFEITDLDSAGQMALLSIVPVLAPYVLSHLLVPMFFYRYAAPASIGLFILVGKGIDNIDKTGLAVGVVGLIVLSSGVMLVDHYNNGTVENIDGAVNCLESETNAGDLVVVQSFWGDDVNKTPLNYYDVFSETQTYAVPPPDQITAQNISQLGRLVEGHDRVWVFMFAPGDVGNQLSRWTDDSVVLETLNQTHNPVIRQNGTTVNVYRYTKPLRTTAATASNRAGNQPISEGCSESEDPSSRNEPIEGGANDSSAESRPLIPEGYYHHGDASPTYRSHIALQDFPGDS